VSRPNGTHTAVTMIPGGEFKQRTLWNQFAQQRLSAWQPILSPGWIISIYMISGVIFIGMGIAFWLSSQSIGEIVHDYTEEDINVSSQVGYFDLEVKSDMLPPIWVYYALDAFHQNHRRYVKSRDDNQLQEHEDPTFDAASVSMCKPWVTTNGRVNYPCGLVARSIFNDTFRLQVKTDSEDRWRELDIDSSASTIAWPADTGGKFRNVDPEATSKSGQENQALLNMWLVQKHPPVVCEQKDISDHLPYDPVAVATRKLRLSAEVEDLFITEPAGPDAFAEIADCRGYMSGNASCNFSRRGEPFDCTGNYHVLPAADWGVENGHFIAWMRVAGLPYFRKLWGRIDTALKKGTVLRVHFQDNFPVKPFGGRKGIVISSSSALGGKYDFLGYGYLFVGCCCLMFGAAFLWRCVMQRSRQLGDVNLLTKGT